jgi:hypothetical protein
MRLLRTGCLIVGLATVAGCSRQQTAMCEPDLRYSTARSAQPVQIPDDLSPPDEGDALRLPSPSVVASPTVAGECLEAPPGFFGDSRPFGRTEDEERQPPSEQPEPTPPAGDRDIGN